MAVAVEDWIAISELLSRYAMTIDQKRIDEWMDLLTDDAVIVIPGLDPMTTPQARRRMAENTSLGVHHPGPPVIREGDGAGTAVAEQSFVFHNLVTGKVVLGWYRDELTKRDRWYLSRREIRFQPEEAT